MSDPHDLYVRATAAVQNARKTMKDLEAQVNKLEDERRQAWIDWQEHQRGYNAYFEEVRAKAQAEVDSMAKG